MAKATKYAVNWQITGSLITGVIHLVQLMLLARFLKPEDFGLVAIASVVIAVTGVFSDFGMSAFIVYKQSLNREEISTLYWMNVLMGLALSLGVVGIAQPLAWFYQMPELKSVIAWLGVTFFVISLGSQFQYQLIKVFALKRLALIDIGARLTGLVVAVGFAWSGASATAIVLGVVATAVAKSFVLLVSARREWLPQWTFRQACALEGLRYGRYQVGGQLLNQFRTNLDNLLLGYFFDTRELGFYSLAKQLVSYPMRLVAPVVHRLLLPSFAACQHTPARLQRLFGKVSRMNSSVQAPIYIFAFAFSDPLVSIVYGEAYAPVGAVLAPLALVWLLRAIVGNVLGPLAQAVGRTEIEFRWNLIGFVVQMLTVVVMASKGPHALAWALVVMQLGLFFSSYVVLVRPLVPVTFWEYFRANAVFILLAATAVSVAGAFSGLLSSFYAELKVTILACMAAMSYWLVMRWGAPGELRAVIAQFRP